MTTNKNNINKENFSSKVNTKIIYGVIGGVIALSIIIFILYMMNTNTKKSYKYTSPYGII